MIFVKKYSEYRYIHSREKYDLFAITFSISLLNIKHHEEIVSTASLKEMFNSVIDKDDVITSNHKDVTIDAIAKNLVFKMFDKLREVAPKTGWFLRTKEVSLTIEGVDEYSEVRINK